MLAQWYRAVNKKRVILFRMRTIKISLFLFAVLLCSNSFAAANNLSEALSQGKVKALLRYSAQYRDTDLHLLQDSSSPTIANQKTQQYSTIGGFVGYETAPWFDTSVGATIYTSSPVGNNPDARRGLGGLFEEDGEQESYTVIGEAYLKVEKEKHLIKGGRQEMPDYRFVSLSDIRMTPITHEGAIYENTVFDNFKINVAYIRRMKERNAETFIDMARGARLRISSNGKTLVRGDFDASDYSAGVYVGENKEMNMLSLIYKTDALSMEAWEYYINDFINIVYLNGQYSFKPVNSGITYSVAAQYANQQDVGDNIAGNIDTWFYGLKLQASNRSLTYFVGYNEVDYNENSYDGGTIFVRWGTPQMFNSFQVQDSELAGTKSYGMGVQYDLGRAGVLPGVVMRLRYADYNLPDSLSQADARQDRAEVTFDIRYSMKQASGFGMTTQLDGLSVLFRIAYNDYETDYDFSAYQAIYGYDFDSVTDSFVDARLYLDYRF